MNDLLKERFYWTIGQWPNKKKGEMNDIFKNERNELFLNDWKKTKWVVYDKRTNEMKKKGVRAHLYSQCMADGSEKTN